MVLMKTKTWYNYGMKAGGCNFRTLPIVARDDDSHVRLVDLLKDNYMDGINPIEFWASSVSGREGLMDTALKQQIQVISKEN